MNCRSDTDCGEHGKCLNSKCSCEKQYATYKPTDKGCNYERKIQTKAFLLELFLGFGIGHFYAERTTNAILKLITFLYGMYLICLFPLSAKFISEKFNSDCLVFIISCFYYLCALCLTVWFIYDLVMFGMNKHKDGNGIDLLPWGNNP